MGRDARLIPLGSSAVTQAPGVLKWGVGVGHFQRSPRATCALRGAQILAGSQSAT